MPLGKDAMADRLTPENAGYLKYDDVLDRLQQRYPAVPRWRVEQIIVAENEAITGGMLTIVPAEVEAGAEEMLARDSAPAQKDGEVA
jgi:hypothetical protein